MSDLYADIRAHDADGRTDEHRADAADAVADEAACESSDEGPEVVYGDDAALQDVVVDDDAAVGALVAESHARVVVVGGVDAAHHALVVAEEEDGEAGDAVYAGGVRNMYVG